MINYLLTIVLISAFCNGLYICMDEGMVLNPIWKRIEKLLMKTNGSEVKYHFLYKPLGGCLACMASVYGSLVYWAIQPFTLTSLMMWPIVIIASVYTNLVLNKLL